MSRIVRARFSPPVIGLYGVRGDQHVELPQYVWVDWLPHPERPARRTISGFYPATMLLDLGTAFVE